LFFFAFGGATTKDDSNEQVEINHGHRLRGQPSNRQVDEAKRQAALALYGKKYGDFGPTLAAEYLAKEGLRVSVETLRLWLLVRLVEVHRVLDRGRETAVGVQSDPFLIDEAQPS
jgi:hypothetical protein